MDKIEWTFILIGELAQLTAPCRLAQTKDAIWQKSSNCYLKLQTNWKHQSFCWQKQVPGCSSFITRLMVVEVVDVVKNSIWFANEYLFSRGGTGKYLRTNNKIFRKLTVQHLLLSGFIINNLLKYQPQNIIIWWSSVKFPDNYICVNHQKLSGTLLSNDNINSAACLTVSHLTYIPTDN